MTQELGLVFFKPAGLVLQRAELARRLLGSPLILELQHTINPVFSDSVPVPTLETKVDVGLDLVFNLDNLENPLTSLASPTEIGLFQHDYSKITSFKVEANPTRELPEVNEAGYYINEKNEFVDVDGNPVTRRVKAKEGDAPTPVGAPAVLNFATSLPLGSTELVENLHEALALQEMQSLINPETGLPLRGPKWASAVAAKVEEYAKLTSFILSADGKLVVESEEDLPDAGADDEATDTPSPTTGITAPTIAAAPPMAAITREQLDAKRERRLAVIGWLQRTFTTTNRLIYRIPLDQLNRYPRQAQIVMGIVEGLDPDVKSLEDFIAKRLGGMVEDSVVAVG